MWIEGVNNAGVDARLRLRGERGSPHPQVGLDVALVAEGHGPPVKTLHQVGTAVRWIRVADYNLEFLFEIIMNARRSCPACRVATMKGGNPLSPPRAQRIAPLQPWRTHGAKPCSRPRRGRTTPGAATPAPAAAPALSASDIGDATIFVILNFCSRL